MRQPPPEYHTIKRKPIAANPAGVGPQSGAASAVEVGGSESRGVGHDLLEQPGGRSPGSRVRRRPEPVHRTRQPVGRPGVGVDLGAEEGHEPALRKRHPEGGPWVLAGVLPEQLDHLLRGLIVLRGDLPARLQKVPLQQRELDGRLDAVDHFFAVA